MLLLVVDAYNLLYRSFVTLPASIKDDSGKPIHAVYGMVGALLRLQKELQPDAVLAAFDTPELPTFRHDLYPLYQAQRGPMGGDQAEEFARQVRLAQDGFPIAGIATAALPGFEADDIMGSTARAAQLSGDRAVLVSTDRDMLQLVGSAIEVLVPGARAARYATPEDVRARMGVDPDSITTFKALAGDGSDNIPGVQSIGPKTAIQLITRFGSLEDIYAGVDEMPGRTADALKRQREDAFLFRRIATIVQTLALENWRGAAVPSMLTTGARARDIVSALTVNR